MIKRHVGATKMKHTNKRIFHLSVLLISILLLISLTIPATAVEGNQNQQGSGQGSGNTGNNSSTQNQSNNPQNQQQGSNNQQSGQNQGSEKPNSGQEQQYQNQHQHNQSQNGYGYQHRRHQYRNMSCTGDHNRSRIRSQWQLNNTIDAFEIEFTTDPEPTLILYYMPTGATSNIQLTFELNLKKIVEFTDLNNNQRYDFNDETLSTYSFDSINFTNITYTYENTSSGDSLLSMDTHTIDNVFTLDLLIADNFTTLSNQLLSPAEMKIDFTIQDYPYLDNTSQLALLLEINTNHNFSVETESFDEKQGYASNESALNISSMQYTGFISWVNTVIVDGDIKPVQASILEDKNITNGNIGQTQYISFTYPHGTKIIHDPKIGVISQSFSLDATTDMPLINTLSELNIYATYVISIVLALTLFLGVVTLRKRL